jgi:5'-3' exonuclease
MEEDNKVFIFIDGSYFCFYRYYALLNWWSHAYPDEKLEDPYQNEIFVEKFNKLFIENVKSIPKKLKLNKNVKPYIFVGKDCKRLNIWRNDLFPIYKINRTNTPEDGFMGGPFFKMVYDNNLFYESGVISILEHPKLEADDVIAITVKELTKKYDISKCTIYIITSDKDYLQLNSPNIHLYNLKFQNIVDNKSSVKDPEKDLLIKILMGDVSDNIPSVFPKCGMKTALKCIEDKEFFVKKMNNNSDYYKQYELNKKIIDFNEIPEDLKNEFLESSDILNHL